MHTDRLLKLAELLEADAVNPTGVKFDLRGWGEAHTDLPLSISCNTQACAFGLAVLSGAFAEFGLSNIAVHPDEIIIPGMPSGADNFQAAAELFDIGLHQAGHLFDPDFYEDGKTEGAEAELEVARRIREMVADHLASQ